MGAAEKYETLHVHVQPGEWVRQALLEPIFGVTPEAARKYRSKGLWLEGTHWRWDPAGVIVYNVKAIGAWMGGQL